MPTTWSSASAHPQKNRLLARLPRRDAERLAAEISAVSAESRENVYAASGDDGLDVFFPDGAVFSHLLGSEGGQVEVGTVGTEGLVIPPERGVAAPQVICQVPGPARRMRGEAFRDEVQRGGMLADLVGRYTRGRLRETQQLVVCNLQHSVEERMCRWLLRVHDEVGNDRLPLTQEFLGLMIGVHRQTVTLTAGVLQRAGLITYGRGWVTVVNRAGLEEAACECYEAVRDEYDRLFPKSELR